jgi:hypothetical protein
VGHKQCCKGRGGELKERLKQYEAMKRDMKVKTKFEEQKSRTTESFVKPAKLKNKGEQSGGRNKSRQTRDVKRKCFNCSGGDHLSAKCPEGRKGVKCFKCVAIHKSTDNSNHVVVFCPGVTRPLIQERVNTRQKSNVTATRNRRA